MYRLIRVAPWVSLGGVLLSLNAFALTVAGQSHQHASGHAHAPGAAVATAGQQAAADQLVREIKVTLATRN